MHLADTERLARATRRLFHERDEAIERIAKFRSVAGGVVVIGMILYYSGLSHTGYTRKVRCVEGGTGGLAGVPETIGKIVAFGGAVTVTILNLAAVARLRKDPDWAFRHGPTRLTG